MRLWRMQYNTFNCWETEAFSASIDMNVLGYHFHHPSTVFPPKPHPKSGSACRSLWRLQILSAQKRCLRCNTLYDDRDNSPTACSFHGHITGEKGLFAFSPPHQGIDGEWSDKSGVIVYKWNDKDNRPNTGRPNWQKRWSCCAEYDENAPPCRKGFHVSYDDGFTLY